MINLNRRALIKSLAGLVTGAIVPIELIPDAAVAEEFVAPSAELLALRDKVQAAIDTLDKRGAMHDYPAVYKQLFTIRRQPYVPRRIWIDGELRDVGDTPYARAVTFKYPTDFSGNWGQRFTWDIHYEEFGLAFGITTRADEAEILPCLLGLIKAFVVQREMDAAKIFNQAMVYNPRIGGDAVSLCSLHHPHEKGFWANTFETQQDLNIESLKMALHKIRTGFVDEAGIRIRARGKKLVVPVGLMERAARLFNDRNWLHSDVTDMDVLGRLYGIDGWIAWDYLESDRNWFVATDVDGLNMIEREPLRIELEIDPRTDTVLVVGKEKRGFGYFDPRAVFGSILETPKAKANELLQQAA